MTHKPMTYKKKKGFTLVELVVVIAVMAVLIAIAIPVFVNIIGKANMNQDIATVETLNTVIASDEFNGPATSLGEAIDVLAADGRNFEEINSQIKNGEIIYDALYNRFSLLEDGELIYKGHGDTIYDNNAVNRNIWRLCHSVSNVNSMKASVYLSSKVSEADRAQDLHLTALISIDAGATPYTGTLFIENEGEANVEVRGEWDRVEVTLPNGTLSHYDHAEYMYIRQLLIEGYYEYGTVGTIEWEKLHGGTWVPDSDPYLAPDIEDVADSTYGLRHRDCEVHGYEQELYFENAFRNGDFAHTLTPVPYANTYPDYVISNAVFGTNPVVSNRLGSWFGWDAKTFTSCNAADAQYNYYTGDGTSALVFRSPEKNINTQLVTRIVLFEGFTYDLSFMYMFQGMHKPSTSDVHMLLLRGEDLAGEINTRVPLAVYDFQNPPEGEGMFHHTVADKEWAKASCTFTVPNTSGNENTHNPVSYYLYFHLYGMQADVLAFDEFNCYPTVQTVENEKAQRFFTHAHTSRFSVPDMCLMYQDERTGEWLGRYEAIDPVLNSRISYRVNGVGYNALEFNTERDVDITTTFAFGERSYSVTKKVKVRKAGMPATVVFLDEFGNEMFRDRNVRVGDTINVNYTVEKANYRQNTWKDNKGNVLNVGDEYYVADSYVVFTPDNYSPKLCGELLIDPYNQENWTGWSNNEDTIVFNPAEKNITISGEYAIGDKHEEHRQYEVELIAGVEYTFMATVQIDHMEIDGVGGNYFAVMVKEDGTNSIDYPVLPASSNFVLYGPNTTISGVTRQINATWVCPEDGKYFVSIIAWSVDDSEITISNLSLRSSQEHCFTGAYDMYCNFCNYHRPAEGAKDAIDYNIFPEGNIPDSTPTASWTAPTDWNMMENASFDASTTHTEDGSGSMKFTFTEKADSSSYNKYMYTEITLRPYVEYEVKFSYKTSEDYILNNNANAYFYVIDKKNKPNGWTSGGEYTWRSTGLLDTTTAWKTYKQNVYFTDGEEARNFVILFMVYGLRKGSLWIDDIAVRPLSPNENQVGVIGKFTVDETFNKSYVQEEDNNSVSHNVHKGWKDFEGWRFRNQVSYSEENAIPGETDSQSLMFTSKGYPGNMRYGFVLDPGNYTLSVRYKYKNLKTVAGDSFIGLVYKDRMEVGDNRTPTWTENFETCGIVIKSFNNGGDPKTITEWQTATISFSVEYTQEMYFVFKFNGNQAGSTIWLDELEVFKNLGENIFTNGNFDYGNSNTYLQGSAMEQDGWIGGWNWATNVGYVTEKSYDKGAGTGSLKIQMNEGYSSTAGDYKGNVKKLFNVTGGLRYELSFMLWAENVENTTVANAQNAKIKIGKWNIAQAVHDGNWSDNTTSDVKGTTSSFAYSHANYCTFRLLNPAGYTKQNGTSAVTDVNNAGALWNTGGWIKVTFTFDADKTEPYYLGIMWNGFTTANSAIYIDDINLRAIGEAQDINLIENGNFATSVGQDGAIVPVEYSYFETTPGWGGWTAAAHTRKTSVSYTNDGSGSLKMINPADRSINGGNTYIGTQVYLQAGVRYEISFMIKIVNPTWFDGGWGWIELRNSTDVGSDASNRTRLVDASAMSVACNWKLVTGTFTPRESGYHYFMILAYGICFDELYLDDLSITPR
ncbi:MAG: prepilin-type N-terminal cleavage/methylation domain-containing protein [Clostridiales bacterium]|nr:prepilin-type N-terminal cleavage/methylation domain-containing protein [Clostridiales bacterium]